jgi:hypothetical protein
MFFAEQALGLRFQSLGRSGAWFSFLFSVVFFCRSISICSQLACLLPVRACAYQCYPSIQLLLACCRLQTEHDDLAAVQPELAGSLLAQLRNVSETCFDPDRGDIDPAACARLMGPNRGFFGPWLEMPAGADDGRIGAAIEETVHVVQNVEERAAERREDSHRHSLHGDYRMQIELEMEESRKPREKKGQAAAEE